MDITAKNKCVPTSQQQSDMTQARELKDKQNNTDDIF